MYKRRMKTKATKELTKHDWYLPATESKLECDTNNSETETATENCHIQTIFLTLTACDEDENKVSLWMW